MDPATLPTALAKDGKKKELKRLEPWSNVKREPTNRILEFADLALGIKGKRRAVDKKK